MQPISPESQLPTAGRFTKKPVTVDAFKWTDQPREEWPGWASMSASIQRKTKDELVASGDVPKSAEEWINFPDVLLQIATPHGWAICNPGDWVVMANTHDIYPVKPDMFESIYAPALPSNAPTYGQLQFENNLVMEFAVEIYQRLNSKITDKMPLVMFRKYFNERFNAVHSRIKLLQDIREARVSNDGGS